MRLYKAEIRLADEAPAARAVEASCDREAVHIVQECLPPGQADLAIDIWEDARLVYRCRPYRH
jgi:hypothetical protein